MREAGVLATWEDELWLELRDLFTSEIKSSFSAQPVLKESLMSKIASAVERVEKSVAWYDGGEMGLGARSLAQVLGSVQRYIVAMDIQGLVQFLAQAQTSQKSAV